MTSTKSTLRQSPASYILQLENQFNAEFPKMGDYDSYEGESFFGWLGQKLIDGRYYCIDALQKRYPNPVDAIKELANENY